MFNATSVRIERNILSIRDLIKYLKMLSICPSRKKWINEVQSSYIQSILLGIPASPLYINMLNFDRLTVIDGVERLNTIRDFIVEKTLTLSSLRFFPGHNGKKFSDLTNGDRRQIYSTEIIVYFIFPGTDESVIFELYRHLNMSLSTEEMESSFKSRMGQ